MATSTLTRPVATEANLPALPALPASDPAAQGRLAALRAVAENYNGYGTVRDALDRVQTGPAPQAFKDAFVDAVHGLTAVLRGN